MNKTILATLLFALPLVLSVWDIEEKIIEQAPPLAKFVWLIPYVSLLFLCLLTLFVLMEVAVYIREAWVRVQPSTLANLAARTARSDDIPEIVDMAKKLVGQRITEENTRVLYNHNKSCLRKVVDTRDNKIVGYFCILPLTSNGENNVMDRDLIGDQIDVKSFSKRFRKGQSVYFGSIAAETNKGRAATLELAKTFLASREINKVFARPVTKRGVKLVKDFGFKPVSEHDRVEENVYVMKIRESV